jgi:hypothetical protein
VVCGGRVALEPVARTHISYGIVRSLLVVATWAA